MTSILLNAKLVTNSEGFVRNVNLDFVEAQQHKHHSITILPGMSRAEVAQTLRKSAEEIGKECETELTR